MPTDTERPKLTWPEEEVLRVGLDGLCWRTTREIAEIVGLPLRSVAGILPSLQRKGLVVRRWTRGRIEWMVEGR